MAVLKILEFPDPRLRKQAAPVIEFNAELQRIIDDMFETMYMQGGVGLAATQVDIHFQIIAIDVSEEKNSPICVINPEIIDQEGIQYEQEGCLSFPGVYDRVERAARLKLRALDRNGKSFELNADELLAVCIQHEMDHLNGILFIDHLSRLKQERLQKKLKKFKRQTISD